jgi:hypothetical protein
MVIYDVVLGVSLARAERSAAPITTAELRAKIDATVERATAARKAANGI